MGDSEETSISDLRVEYRAGALRRKDLNPDPFLEFQSWFSEALDNKIREANAMTLSTVASDGSPMSRTVLMKGISEEGITFFSNYESRKAREIAANDLVSVLFFWRELEKQIQVRGRIEKTSQEESEAYFFSRPWKSRIGAWASRQSEEISNREWLEERFAEFASRFPDTGKPDCVPLPDDWGGYRIRPNFFEFWRGQPARVHDRFVYLPSGDSWIIQRLSP